MIFRSDSPIQRRHASDCCQTCRLGHFGGIESRIYCSLKAKDHDRFFGCLDYQPKPRTPTVSNCAG